MELSGTIAENLRAAIASARRLRKHRVHVDTLHFWTELLDYARLRLRQAKAGESDEMEPLIADLQSELAERER